MKKIISTVAIISAIVSNVQAFPELRVNSATVDMRDSVISNTQPKKSHSAIRRNLQVDTSSPTSQPTAPTLPPSASPTSPTNSPTRDCDSSKRPLCGSNSIRKDIQGDCSSQVVSFASLEPCCEVQSILSDPCEIKDDGLGKCRTVEIETPACTARNAICRSMTLKLELETTKQNTTCCETCACYGDPHCESFKGVIDTWILCDARVPQKGGGCKIMQSQCGKEKDHNGNDCYWRRGNPKYWSTGLQGSQCIFDMENQKLPSMLMYKADDFRVDLSLGERGIIWESRIESNGQVFFMNAGNCFDAYGVSNPWRDSETATGPLADPKWLPNTWLVTKLPGGDVLWSIFGLSSGMQMNIRCTRTGERVNGKMRYGPPRLNIEEIVEPFTISERKDVDGFCVTDKINKAKSTTEHSDHLMLNHICDDAPDALEIARKMCSKGLSELGLQGCYEGWCKNNRPLDWEKCVLDIGRFQWPRVWCAANTIKGGNPSLCTSGICRQCVSDIADFGWDAAMNTWKNKVPGTGIEEGDCLNIEDLPKDLVSCQKGIKLQYKNTAGEWITYLAIPENVELCDKTLNFEALNSVELFVHPIRIQQCSLDASCLQDRCTPENGFSATFRFDAEAGVTSNLVALVQNDDLICDPTKFSSKHGCIRIEPPKMCPCQRLI